MILINVQNSNAVVFNGNKVFSNNHIILENHFSLFKKPIITLKSMEDRIVLKYSISTWHALQTKPSKTDVIFWSLRNAHLEELMFLSFFFYYTKRVKYEKDKWLCDIYHINTIYAFEKDSFSFL